MINYLVIGICIALLFAVIFFSAKPISMGIEARRNLKDKETENEDSKDTKTIQDEDISQNNQTNISDEILKLNKLKNDGVLTEVEYEKAKKKLLD
tara:strand:+ start:310 stop:594 length:285 start_codon:yes stop_codon:yes gene_type:complete